MQELHWIDRHLQPGQKQTSKGVRKAKHYLLASNVPQFSRAKRFIPEFPFGQDLFTQSPKHFVELKIHS